MIMILISDLSDSIISIVVFSIIIFGSFISSLVKKTKDKAHETAVEGFFTDEELAAMDTAQAEEEEEPEMDSQQEGASVFASSPITDIEEIGDIVLEDEAKEEASGDKERITLSDRDEARRAIIYSEILQRRF